MISIIEVSDDWIKNKTRTATFFNPQTLNQYGRKEIDPSARTAIDARANRAWSLRDRDLESANQYKTLEKQTGDKLGSYKQLPTKEPISYRTSTGKTGVYNSSFKDSINRINTEAQRQSR